MSSKEARLEAELRELAASTAQLEAPAELEAKLRAAYRRQRPARWPYWAAAVAAGVLLAAGAAAWVARRPTPAPAAPVVAASPQPVVVLPPAPVGPPAVARRLPATRPARVRPREVATEFLPLQYGEILAPLESGNLVRVRLPRSSLTSFGLPVAEERMAERISADVLLGEDGTARAIRFVSLR